VDSNVYCEPENRLDVPREKRLSKRSPITTGVPTSSKANLLFGLVIGQYYSAADLLI